MTQRELLGAMSRLLYFSGSVIQRASEQDTESWKRSSKRFKEENLKIQALYQDLLRTEKADDQALKPLLEKFEELQQKIRELQLSLPTWPAPVSQPVPPFYYPYWPPDVCPICGKAGCREMHIVCSSASNPPSSPGLEPEENSGRVDGASLNTGTGASLPH